MGGVFHKCGKIIQEGAEPRPWVPYGGEESAQCGPKARNTSRGACAEDFAHHEAQVERSDVYEVSLENVRVTTQPSPSHCACLQAVRETSLDPFSSQAHQPTATLAFDSAAVCVGASTG